MIHNCSFYCLQSILLLNIVILIIVKDYTKSERIIWRTTQIKSYEYNGLGEMKKMLKDKNIKITDSNQALFVDLDNKGAEIISGGVESFKIKNKLGRDVKYSIDGSKSYNQKKDSTVIWATTGEGRIDYDASFEPGTQHKRHNLVDQTRYIFQYDTETWWNSEDFKLYIAGTGLT